MKKTILEIFITIGFLSSLLLTILSYKIAYLNLDKFGIIIFLSSAFINAAHWCKIIESENKKTNSIQEAINEMNEIFNKKSSHINHALRPQFKNTDTLEYRFQKLENKDFITAIIIMNQDLKQIIPIVLLTIIPIWAIGTSHFRYQRYYIASPALHDALLYLSILSLGTLMWLMISLFAITYLIKIRHSKPIR